MGLSKLDPRTKFAWYALMIYFALSTGTAVQLCLVLLVCIMASLILTGSLKQYKVMIMIILLLGFQILTIQLIFCREGVLLYQSGILKIYSEALPLAITGIPVSYTHLRAHETRHDLVCRLLLEKKKNN